MKFSPHRKHCFSITKTTQLQFLKHKSLYIFKENTKQVNTFYERNTFKYEAQTALFKDPVHTAQ